MDKNQFDYLKAWFDDYVAKSYVKDDYINANLKLKEVHTDYVIKEMDYLTDSLALDDNQKRIARTIALFHDVGRFPQFIKYRTYNDTRSVKHNKLSLEVLRDNKVLEGIDPEEKKIIETAIACHSIKELPATLNDEELFFCQLIRDADKLDIYRVVIDYYGRYERDPKTFILEMEYPNLPHYSPKVIQAVLNGEKLDYKYLKTWNDAKLLQLGWVYDINFTASLKRIRERKLLEQIASFLPDSEDIKKVRDKVLRYIEERIEAQNQ
jgi:hypothetical protein